MRVPDRMPGRAVVAVVAVIALVATGLLLRTERTAAHIHDRTRHIAVNARGINDYTDSILQLQQTNARATAILAALAPLSGPLAAIDTKSLDVAALLRAIRTGTQSIDGSSTSIRTSSATIRDGTRAIDDLAHGVTTRLAGINENAARILTDFDAIQHGLEVLNGDLPTVRAVLAAILADSGDLLTALGRTEHLAGCIDNGLNGNAVCRAGR